MSIVNACIRPLRNACMAAVVGLWCGAVAAVPYATLSGDGATPSRQFLDFGRMQQGSNNANSVSNSAFVPPDNAAMPTNTFNGTLQLNGADLRNGSKFQVLYGTKKDTSVPLDAPEMHYLPNFSFQFVQDGTHLIPLKRNYQAEDAASGHPFWEYIIGPGRVWNENTDNGFSRAAFTFAVTEKGQNCVHNGMMSFLFKSSGEISSVWYQITAETCAYYKIDLWGFARASFTPGGIAQPGAVISAYRAEVANQLDMLPIEQLATDLAGIDQAALEPQYSSNANTVNVSPNPYSNPSEHNPAHLLNYGVMVNDKIYSAPVRTRSGAYPYPQWMVYPLYSWSKAEFVGNAVALIAKLHPDGVPGTPADGRNKNLKAIENLVVADWIPEARLNGTWENVTLGNLIDMGSGHYINKDIHLADENSAATISQFFDVLTNAGKLNFAANYYPSAASPGQVFAYHTSDFYLAARMLELVSQKVNGVGIVQSMADNIYNGLKLSRIAQTPKLTYDGAAQPYGGYGHFGYADDIAKLGRFMAVHKGAIGNTQVLNAQHVTDVLQLNPANQGLTVTPLGASFRFNNGYWSKNLISAGGCKPRIVFESGFGGLSKVLGTAGPGNPGWVYYYVSDNGEFLYAAAVNSLAAAIGCPNVGTH